MTTDINQRLAEIKERWPVTDADERDATQDIRYLLADRDNLLNDRMEFAIQLSHHDKLLAECKAEIERRDERVKVLEDAINEARPIIAYLASATAPDEDMDKHFGSKITTIHARLKIVAK